MFLTERTKGQKKFSGCRAWCLRHCQEVRLCRGSQEALTDPWPELFCPRPAPHGAADLLFKVVHPGQRPFSQLQGALLPLHGCHFAGADASHRQVSSLANMFPEGKVRIPCNLSARWGGRKDLDKEYLDKKAPHLTKPVTLLADSGGSK